MKSNKLLYLLFVAALLASCTSYDSKEILPGGTPVEVNLSFALAGVEYPQVEVTSGSASSVTSTTTKAQSASSSVVSTGSKSSSTKTSPLQVSYTEPAGSIQLRSGTSLSNVWVLQFDSTLTTGATSATGACVAAKYLGSVSTGDNLNPTLFTGTGQVLYVIANGPSAGDITTSTYTLETFKSSAYFSGTITGDATVPYLGRIAGGTTIDENGEVYAAALTPVITLYRIAAKISLNLNFAVTGYTLTSVQLFNSPTYMYYLNGASTASFPTASSAEITTTGKAANSIPSTAASGTYGWYTGENKRGTSSTATTDYLKDFLHTPTDNDSYYYCTYIRVQAKKNDSTTVMNYYLYIGENGTTDFNVKRNWDYTINATMGGNEATQQAFMGIDGRIRMSTSNCYIVAPGSTITIPVNVRGNANSPLPPDASSTVLAGTGLDAFQSTAAATVSVLWQTASGLITVGTFNTSSQTVSITGNAAGNGVIVAKDASSNVLWSWHIWVTDYNPETTTDGTYTITNTASAFYTFMDRNLGATTSTAGEVGVKGLFYQWGRKDPFPGSTTLDGTTEPTLDGTITAVTKTQVAASNNLANSILYPGMFYYGIDNVNTGYDWYTATNDHTYQNQALWGGASKTAPTDKTIFDPCPAGWRVPAWSGGYSPWSAIGLNEIATSAVGSFANYGVTWSVISAGFWPAAGYRTPSSGALGDVGSFGSYWSASPFYYGYHLYFTSSYVYPSGYNTRAYGFAVRCVRE